MANVPNLSVVRDPGKAKKLGRYELEECLGAEGGRETYRARVRGLAGFDRIFAVKCLRRPPGQAPGRTDPFIVAAKRVGSVTDARVAKVLDTEVIDGVAVVVTEFVAGLDLDRVREWAHVSGELATGSEPAAAKWQRLVAYLGSEIAGALAAMHALVPPLVHGGLSPRNVIISSRGGIKLVDVGLGVAAQKVGEALSQRVMAYAAPAPLGAEPTAAGDVRALGAMLFELGTGELPPAGVTSAGLRRILETAWPSMAPLLASMLAEDPTLRPRANEVAEILAKPWADVAGASMESEMAGLVRNFSAFVADSSPPAAPATPGVEAPVPEPPKPPPGGLPEMAPPGSSLRTGSFLSLSDQPTRVNADGGYASAIFRALPADAPAPAVGPAGFAPASGPAASGLKARPFVAPKPGTLGKAVLPPLPPAPRVPAPAPAMTSSPGRTAIWSAAPAEPWVPPAPAPAPPARTLIAAPSPAPASRPGAAMAPLARTLMAPPSPAPPPGLALAAPAPPARSEPTLEEPAEPEPMAETMDWGAQALAALGTQAGVAISLLPAPAEGGLASSEAEPPPPVSDPAIEEAFAFAPHPPPPAESWSAPQPVSQPSGPPALEAFVPLAPAAPAFASPGSRELLEDELLDEEPTPLLVSTNDDTQGPPVPVATAEACESPEDFAESSPVPPAALEATAFVADDESAPGPEVEPEPQEAGEAGFAPEPTSRRAATHSALRSETDFADEGLEDESWQLPRSRTKRIVVVLIVAAAVGAGAAALTIGPFGSKKGGAPPALKPRVQKVGGSPAATKASPAQKAPVAAAVAQSGPATSRPAAGLAVPAGKTPGATAEKAAGATAEKVVAPVAEKPASASAANVAPAPAEKIVPTPSAASGRPARAVAGASDAVAGKAAPEREPTLARVAGGAVVRVQVGSQPEGARVWIDGEDRGQTPCTIPVKSGSARVLLVRAGYLTSQSTVEVREGTKIDETLKAATPPMTGEARFRAECQTTGKLPIVVDGKETGILCPFSKMRVDPGTHTIGLLVPSTGKVHQKEVTLSPGVRSVVFGD